MAKNKENTDKITVARLRYPIGHEEYGRERVAGTACTPVLEVL